MEKIITSHNNLVTYNYEIYDMKTGEYTTFMEKGTKEYNMLFKDNTDKRASYWTTAKYINVTERHAALGYKAIKPADLNYNT